MRLAGTMLVVIALGACKPETPQAQRGPAPADAFNDNLVGLRDANNAIARQIAAQTLVFMCCPDRVDAFPDLRGYGPEACQELAAVIDREQDSMALSGAFASWGPACYETIPLRSLLGALPRARGDARASLVTILASMDPTPEIVRHLTQQLGTSEKRIGLEDALAAYGEPDLGPLVDALRDPQVVVRRRAALTWSFAFVDGPLELPEGEAALERALHDPDPEVAAKADVALWSRDLAAETPLDQYVEKASAPYRVQLLARRAAFCQSKAATEVLEQQARDAHLTTAYLAKRAIALRARRCAEAARPRRP